MNSFTLLFLLLSQGFSDVPGGGDIPEFVHTSALQLHLDDDIKQSFGNTSADPDVWLDNNGTSMCLTSTSVDGGGTDGNVWCYTLGGNVVSFGSDIDLNTNGKQLILDAGTVNNPAIVLGDDDDGTGTGIFRSGADTLAIAANGQQNYFFTQDYLLIYKPLDMFNAHVYNSGGILEFGGNMTSSHSLGTGDAGVLGALEVDGALWADNGLTVAGHVTTSGSSPTLSSCGTSPSISGTDTAGKVTIGTAASDTCTLTFASAYANAPACTVTGDDTAFALAATTSTTALTITCPGASDFSSDVINYICIGL